MDELEERSTSKSIRYRRCTSSHTFGSIKPQDMLRLLQRRRHFLDYSAPGSKSLQQHVHALIQNFDSCNAMP
jgi:hypothetical protein